MARDDLRPRRKRDPRGLAPQASSGAARRGPTREAVEVASYIADLTAQLEPMAQAARLDLLAYFLAMARAEAGLFVRDNAEIAADDVLEESDGGQAAFDHSGG